MVNKIIDIWNEDRLIGNGESKLLAEPWRIILSFGKMTLGDNREWL